MARIIWKDRKREPRTIPDDKGKKMAKDLTAFKALERQDFNFSINGEGSYPISSVETVDIEPERKYSLPVEKEMTPAEVEESKKAMARVRQNLINSGIITKK